MTSKKVIPLLAFISRAYPQFTDVKWFSQAAAFFTRDECMFPSPSITNTQSAQRAEEKKKNWLREDLHAALLCNLAASCSLPCPRPQEVPQMLTKSRLNPWLRSETSFSPRHISKMGKHVMWSSPENTHSQERREQLGRQLRRGRDLAASPGTEHTHKY